MSPRTTSLFAAYKKTFLKKQYYIRLWSVFAGQKGSLPPCDIYRNKPDIKPFSMKQFLFMYILFAFSTMTASTLQAQDWASLKRFQTENTALALPKPGEKRVVFMGNSITEGWKNIDPSFFKDKPYVNRGISGQTTPQMLVRFRQDVISLTPAAVVILAGTNDIAGNTGPTTIEEIMGHIASMADLARVNGIAVVLSSVLPVYDYPWKPGLEPAEKIFRLNSMIKAYCEQHGCVYLDYFSAMADERKGLRSGLGDDGVHPNLAGYQIMGPLAEQAIARALRSKKR